MIQINLPISVSPVDPVRIPPLALDPYLVEQRYHRQHLRIFDVSIFVILDACLNFRISAQCCTAGASCLLAAGLCDTSVHASLIRTPPRRARDQLALASRRAASTQLFSV